MVHQLVMADDLKKDLIALCMMLNRRQCKLRHGATPSKNKEEYERKLAKNKSQWVSKLAMQ